MNNDMNNNYNTNNSINNEPVNNTEPVITNVPVQNQEPVMNTNPMITEQIPNNTNVVAPTVSQTKTSKFPSWVKTLIIVLIIAACIIGFFVYRNNQAEKKAINTDVEELEKDVVEDLAQKSKDINGKTSFKLNEPFQNEWEKVTLTNVINDFKDYSEYSKPQNGYKYIALEFTITNVGEKDNSLYANLANLSVYADDKVAKKTFADAIDTSDKYKDFGAEELALNKSTSGYVFYEIPVNSKKIVAKFNPYLANENYLVDFIIQ